MSKLSPAAQAVFEAAWTAYWPKDAEQPADAELIAAAAIRAAADKASAPDHHEEDAFHAGFWAAIEYVQSIADELEAQ